MQKTTPTTSASQQAEVNALFSENRMHDFFAENGRKVLYIILGLILLFLVMYRMSSGKKASAISDYMLANVEYQRIEESSLSDILAPDGALSQMKEILTRRPELHAKYDGLIAQILLIKGDPKAAQEFATLAFNRLQDDHLPFYIDYTQATLLISEERYQEALTRALDLKQKMVNAATSAQVATEKHTFGGPLFAFNLLRIAMLQQQIGTPEEESKAWTEFMSVVQPQEGSQAPFPLSPEAIRLLTAHFQEGHISLQNYIEQRGKK